MNAVINVARRLARSKALLIAVGRLVARMNATDKAYIPNAGECQARRSNGIRLMSLRQPSYAPGGALSSARPVFSADHGREQQSAEFGPKANAADARCASSLRGCEERMTSGADHRSHDGQACINVHERTDDAAAVTRKRRPRGNSVGPEALRVTGPAIPMRFVSTANGTSRGRRCGVRPSATCSLMH